MTMIRNFWTRVENAILKRDNSTPSTSADNYGSFSDARLSKSNSFTSTQFASERIVAISDPYELFPNSISMNSETPKRKSPKRKSPEDLAALIFNTPMQPSTHQKTPFNSASEPSVDTISLLRVKIPNPDFDELNFLEIMTVGVPIKVYAGNGKVLKCVMCYNDQLRIICVFRTGKRFIIRKHFSPFPIYDLCPLACLQMINLASLLPPYEVFCPSDCASRSVSMVFDTHTVNISFKSDETAKEVTSGFLELRRVHC